MHKLSHIVAPILIFVAGCGDITSTQRSDSSAPTTKIAPNQHQIKRSLRKLVPQRMAYEMNYPNDASDYHVTEVVEKDVRTYLVKGYWEIVVTRRSPDYDFRNRKHNRYREKQPFEVKSTLRHSETASEKLDMSDFDYQINVLWKRGSRVRVN